MYLSTYSGIDLSPTTKTYIPIRKTSKKKLPKTSFTRTTTEFCCENNVNANKSDWRKNKILYPR